MPVPINLGTDLKNHRYVGTLQLCDPGDELFGVQYSTTHGIENYLADTYSDGDVRGVALFSVGGSKFRCYVKKRGQEP